jgi:hypothetical protein
MMFRPLGQASLLENPQVAGVCFPAAGKSPNRNLGAHRPIAIGGGALLEDP